MIILPNLGYFQVFFDYTQRPLMQSIVKKKCLNGKTPIQATAIFGNGRHKLDLDSHPHSEAIFLRYEYDLSGKRLKLFTLSIQLILASFLKFDAIECASRWHGLLITDSRIAFNPDRILFRNFGETPAEVALEIL